VVAALGGLPEQKIHCSVLAENATRAALSDWERRQCHSDTAEVP